jgi:uncharacterized membrane protein (DUF2068 family)
MSTRFSSPAAAPPAHYAADVFALVRTAAARATIAVGLAGIAVIHAVDSVGHWSDARYLFWMYMALIVAALGLASLVVEGLVVAVGVVAFQAERAARLR